MLKTKKVTDQKTWDVVIKWSEKGASWAHYLLANWYEQVDDDVQTAYKLYEKAAKQDHARSCFMLGHLHMTKIAPRNVQLAVFWFKKAIEADAKMADAYFVLGCICSEGYEIREYLDLDATDFWELAAKEGHVPALKRLQARGFLTSRYPAPKHTHILV
jgi:TPR repeat protein